MAIIPHGGPILTTTTDHMQVIIHVEVKWRPNNVEIFQNLISDSLYYLLLLTKNKIDQNQQHEENRVQTLIIRWQFLFYYWHRSYITYYNHVNKSKMKTGQACDEGKLYICVLICDTDIP